MALLTAFGGYAVFVVARRVLPRTSSSVVVASGVAAGVSVLISAVAFTTEYAIGGTGTAAVSTVAGAMVGVHMLIGIGEGVITGLVVGAVLATRPDLVWGARDLAFGRAPTDSVPEEVAS
ncbi:MAG TPA: energy-coupling factor ABC transporter permease, partial [Acidimicrobiales bacterium]|nr:energy-coupling factor ABC transporter permease [Acidimicrobiales bacterium]